MPVADPGITTTLVDGPWPGLRCAGIMHLFELSKSRICQCGSEEWHDDLAGSRPALRLVEPAPADE